MYLTARDKNILIFIEEHGSITINQCSKIFFKECKNNYDAARKRLRILNENKYIKKYRRDIQSELVYYLCKPLSPHNLKVLDVYAMLVYIGVEVKYFKREYSIDTGIKKYRNDALIEFIHDGYFYTLLVEVDQTHMTSNKKIRSIYHSGHFQKKYKKYDENLFPRILIIRHQIQENYSPKNDELYSIYYTDWELNNFKRVLE